MITGGHLDLADFHVAFAVVAFCRWQPSFPISLWIRVPVLMCPAIGSLWQLVP